MGYVVVTVVPIIRVTNRSCEGKFPEAISLYMRGRLHMGIGLVGRLADFRYEHINRNC